MRSPSSDKARGPGFSCAPASLSNYLEIITTSCVTSTPTIGSLRQKERNTSSCSWDECCDLTSSTIFKSWRPSLSPPKDYRSVYLDLRKKRAVKAEGTSRRRPHELFEMELVKHGWTSASTTFSCSLNTIEEKGDRRTGILH